MSLTATRSFEDRTDGRAGNRPMLASAGTAAKVG